MVAVMLATPVANIGLFLYWALFSFTNLGAFAMLWVNRQKDLVQGQDTDHPYEKFAGLIKTMPVAAVVMALFMLSLAGIPPLGLFWGKMYLISAAVISQEYVLALIMALNSAIAGYYYLKLIVYMFMKDPILAYQKGYFANASLALKTIIGIAGVATVFSLFAVEPLLRVIAFFLTGSM